MSKWTPVHYSWSSRTGLWLSCFREYFCRTLENCCILYGKYWETLAMINFTNELPQNSEQSGACLGQHLGHIVNGLDLGRDRSSACSAGGGARAVAGRPEGGTRWCVQGFFSSKSEIPRVFGWRARGDIRSQTSVCVWSLYLPARICENKTLSNSLMWNWVVSQKQTSHSLCAELVSEKFVFSFHCFSYKYTIRNKKWTKIRDATCICDAFFRKTFPPAFFFSKKSWVCRSK